MNLAYYVPKDWRAGLGRRDVHPRRCAEQGQCATSSSSYLLQPEVIAACTNFTNYANANKAANQAVCRSGHC
jgi:hypothetical protein